MTKLKDSDRNIIIGHNPITGQHQADNLLIPMPILPEKIISISTKKIIGILIGCLLFVCLGLWMISLDASVIANSRRRLPIEIVHGLGWFMTLICGGCSVFVIKRLYDKRPGLLLNEHGVIDHSSAIAAGFIPWTDITGFAEYQQNGQRTLVIRVQDPQKYISRANFWKKMAYKANLKLIGSPLAISPNTLQVTFDELLHLMQIYARQYS
jgi:hypothetical protein